MVDPMGNIARWGRLGGQVIERPRTAPSFINPMDIQLDLRRMQALSMKADFLLSLCELVVRAREWALQPIEKTVIDRRVW